MLNTDIVLKGFFAFGIFAYLLYLEESPARRWVHWALIGLFVASVNGLLWLFFKIGLIALFIGNVLTFMLLRGIWSFRMNGWAEENCGVSSRTGASWSGRF